MYACKYVCLHVTVYVPKPYKRYNVGNKCLDLEQITYTL